MGGPSQLFQLFSMPPNIKNSVKMSPMMASTSPAMARPRPPCIGLCFNCESDRQEKMIPRIEQGRERKQQQQLGTLNKPRMNPAIDMPLVPVEAMLANGRIVCGALAASAD